METQNVDTNIVYKLNSLVGCMYVLGCEWYQLAKTFDKKHTFDNGSLELATEERKKYKHNFVFHNA